MSDKFGSPRSILRNNAQRAADRGEIRSHEVERVVDIAETLFVGQKGNGQATSEAIALIKKGQA